MAKLFSLLFFILSFSLQSQIIILTTTSKSSGWSPQTVIKTGEAMTWKASATGMTDQVIITLGSPSFDLSLSRSSEEVTITVNSPDGASGLTELRIADLNITFIDLQKVSGLQKLNCSNNLLKDLDVLNNTNLIELNCNSNYKIKELIVSTNKLLKTLICFNSEIENLDLSENINLTLLSCGSNKIKDLDLSINNSLISLECDNNQLNSLNIKNGNNINVNFFNSINNNNLQCIQVDDETADYLSNWTKDDHSKFNNDCTFANRPPVANDDLYELDDNTILIIDAENGVLKNDTDHEGSTLSAILETDVSHGSLDLNANGSFTYTPDQNYYGADYFTYKANDGDLDSNIATATLNVILDNSPPISNENSYTTKENEVLEIENTEGVLSNDNDPDGDILTAYLVSDVTNGVLNFSLDGSFIYSPNTKFFGEDIFTYNAFDGFEYSTTTQVKIKVEAIIEIVVPNAFSPNNDQVNDTFRPVFKGMSNVRLQIYDTWGNLIYFEEGQNLAGWDGKIKGKDAENGNYLYLVTATTLDEQTMVSDGMLTLIK